MEHGSAMPTHIGIIDLVIGFPFTEGGKASGYARAVKGVKDDASKDLKMPAGYMFDAPDTVHEEEIDPIDVTFQERTSTASSRDCSG